MSLFIIALLLAAAALYPLLTGGGFSQQPAGNRIAGVGLLLLALLLGAVSGIVTIGDDQTGIVSVNLLAPDLPTGRIVGLNGEKGPQAQILGPGWHWVNPLTKSAIKQDVLLVPNGQVGIIVANEGKPLPAGLTYAPAWEDTSLLDAEKFLTSDKHGFKGAQLTVLPPGKYRYNTALFTITTQPALIVKQGEVVVIKDNTGRPYPGDAETVNGNRLVPRGYSGIWNVALTPDTYYLHHTAFTPIRVKSIQRVYTYQKTHADDNSINIRSKDGFTIATDIRVVVVVTPENAPRLVALHGDPDLVTKSFQEDETLENLEAQGVLPVVRAEVRNIGEKINALDLINQRAEKETELSARVKAKLESGYLKVIAVYLANVDLTVTEAGKNLLQTQTDQEIAKKQVDAYNQQKLAEDTRKTLVNAITTANTEKELVESQRSVLINEQKGQAMLKLADYQRQSYLKVVEALGVDNAAKLEFIRLAGEKNVVITPQVFLGNDTAAAVAGALFMPKK
jgi:ferredoxin-fold anticodon binding domain-containing protein